jgi:hypothetical protein
MDLESDLKAAQKVIEEQTLKLQNFELVNEALKAKPVKNQFVEEFTSLVENDFKAFCDVESNLNDVVEVDRLRGILNEMRLIANCPAMRSKNLGAIGGGFSSGKSSFINSFISGSDIRLAEGIRPVTAIPSYVICDKKSQVNGISYKGGSFNIANDLYKVISHEFLKSFSFDLKDIVLYTTVSCQINSDIFSSICLIDTPGYNPAGSSTTDQDLTTAKEYVKNAQFLIWIVGLDTNGTIPKSDLDFLDELAFGKDKPLYIVANKAELKNKDDIDNILDIFEECLDDRDIVCAGISAYSSKKSKIYAKRKLDLFDFLKDQNKASSKFGELAGLIYDVFEDYLNEIKRDNKANDSKRKEIKSILFDAYESGSNSDGLEESLNNLINSFMPKESLDKRTKRATALYETFLNCFYSFCADVNIKKSILDSIINARIKMSQEKEDMLKKEEAKVEKEKNKIREEKRKALKKEQEKKDAVIKKTQKKTKKDSRKHAKTYHEKLKEIYALTPQDNCGECDMPNCYAFSMKVASGKWDISDCPYIVSEDDEYE